MRWLETLPDPFAPGMARRVERVAFTAYGELLSTLIARSHRPVAVIVPRDKDMEMLAAICRFVAPSLETLTLPAWDTLPYDRVSPSAEIISERVATLSRLAAGGSGQLLLITTVSAASQFLPPPTTFRDHHFTVTAGQRIDREALTRFLEAEGYQRSGKVMEMGEYAVRGSILDIFPSGAPFALRLDTFGDDLESLRSFDPLTQITEADIATYTLLPRGELQLSAENIARFRIGYRELFGAVTREDPLYESVSAGKSIAGMEHWLPLFYERMATVFDYLPEVIWCQHHEVPAMLEERAETVADYYEARRHPPVKSDTPYHPVPPERMFLLSDAWKKHWQASPTLTFTPFAEGTTGAITSPYDAAPRFPAGTHIPELAANLMGQPRPVLIACNSTGSRDRIRHMLAEQHVTPLLVENAAALGKAGIHLAVLAIERGYQSPELLVLSEEDLLGERIIRTQKKRRKSEAFLLEASSFKEGELVVHREHGVARFEALVTVEVQARKHDCLKLLYDGGDRLFLPVENIDLISRYGDASEHTALDKLGGVAWQKRKSGLKKRLRMAAEALMKIAAERAMLEAPPLIPDAAAYEEFCARFPYSETEDQLQSIEEVLADLAKGTPMDRLICGDVGFGKTEVAMRAAFVAASQGYQVALVAPTTLLARQHLMTFRARFQGLPIRIGGLSRMVRAKEAAEVRCGLADGSVHIVIGTHALLAKDIAFAKLGLVIVDEEQHFGVKQKERLKEFQTGTHLLTLSATPIPRTLQMSLAGVRELSLITTPPVDRLAIRSYVMPFDGVVIREAILREYHRGGKVFVVTPRIEDMAELTQRLKTLVPEISIAAAHGQMGAAALDTIMNEFYDGKYDALISTAIIESGIDIPTANTIIIDRAHRFGLAQLYQLRGRVGRSKTRAYAYFTLPAHQLLTREATRRLEVMQQLDHLGAGFALSSHDMDIRGYGNLLGEEQSGHIREVGVELYQAMLEEAVQELKQRQHARARAASPLPTSPREQGEEHHEWSPQINLGMSVLIPESYVEDLSLRLSLYRRASSLHDASDIESFAAELIDRFGTLPQEVAHLLAVLRIKQLCLRAGIARIDAGPKGAVLSFYQDRFVNPDALLAYLAKHPTRFKLRADQKLLLMEDLSRESNIIPAITRAVSEIAALISPALKAA
jgi:transcription-repair coupling factor (superfamily II helicase)